MKTDNSRKYKALYQLSRKLHNHRLDEPGLIQLIISRTADMLGVRHGCMVTFNDADDAKTMQDIYMLDEYQQVGWEHLLERGLIGFVYHAERVIIIRNMETDPRWPNTIPEKLRTGSAIGLPVYDDERVYGVLIFTHPQVDFFNETDVEVLGEVADLTRQALKTIQHRAQSDYETAFNAIAVPLLLTDLNGSILKANQAAADLLGYSAYKLVGHSIHTIHQADHDLIAAQEPDKLLIGQQFAFQGSAKTRNGAAVPVNVRVNCVQVEGQRALEWAEVDATQQAEAEQHRGDLAAMIYHDLRGPLQAVRMSMNKLAQLVEDPAAMSILQIGLRGTHQLHRMIDGLLDIQSLENGSVNLHHDLVDLRALLLDTVQLMQPALLEAKQQIDLAIDDVLPPLYIDRDMILRVVLNLLENAMKYTPPEGKITLTTRIQDAQIQISVRDTGPGIPKEHQQQIFDKFNRVNHQNAPSGVGLGLTFCRLAVQAHQGKIWVESAPDEGACFSFTLPLGQEKENGDSIALVNSA